MNLPFTAAQFFGVFAAFLPGVTQDLSLVVVPAAGAYMLRANAPGSGPAAIEQATRPRR